MPITTRLLTHIKYNCHCDKLNILKYKFFLFFLGQFAADCRNNVPCLVYATFNNKIKVFNDIKMADIGNTTLLEKMKEHNGLSQLLDHLNCDGEYSQLVHWQLVSFSRLMFYDAVM